MDYFNPISAHMHGEMDIDGAIVDNSSSHLISLGCDDLIAWRNLTNNDNQNGELSLPSDHGFRRIALHPSGSRFLLGGQSKKVCEFSTVTKQMTSTLYESLGAITDVKYSPTGRFISIASQQLRLMVIDTQNNRKMKCRPGHQNKVFNTFFSSRDRYVASIGQDCFVLIYELFPDKDPQEVFRSKFTGEKVPFEVKGCFCDVKQGFRIYVPGTSSLQIVEQLATRWQIKKSNIAHSSNIIIAQITSPQCLATSCQKDLCIWSIQNQQKLIVLEGSAMLKVIPVLNTFIGHRNDGSIYVYNRPLPSGSSSQQKQIEAEENQSRIQFDGDEAENIELEYDQQGEEVDYEKQVQILTSKKRIADKIIKVYPQVPLTRATSFMDQNRFLFMNLHGCIYETRQVDQISTYAEFNRKNQKQPLTKLLFKNKQLKYFDMNSQNVCYASENQYGIKIDKFSSWEKDWFDIQGVALSGNWMAVANVSEIRFIDLSGNVIKVVSFDRPILAMQTYQNLLAIVFHESIPMYDSQLLAMKVFSISQFSAVDVPDCHVPLTVPEFSAKGCTLKWFGFSQEGMIFSQDSFGMIRAYSLQTNEWTPLLMEALTDPKKAWIVGFQNYQMVYWRITDSEPEPTVRPRLNMKTSKLMFPSLQQSVQELQSLPNLLWQRYCLDHQLARWRLWGRHKLSRGEKHVNFGLSSTIKDEKKIYDENLQLDVQLFRIIKYYLKSQQPQKALGFIKTHIRSIQAGKDLIEMLDSCNHRNQAVDLEYFYDQKQREVQYETMQDLALKELKSKVEISVKAKKENPMNPKFKKPANSPMPFSMSSQQSQNSSIMEDITHKSQDQSKVQQEIQNPFLKKKSTNDRKQEIQEHIEKYGVKRKVDEKKKTH